MTDNISTKISKLINLGNENLAQKGITTTQTTMRDVVDSIANIQTGIVPSGQLEITENGVQDVTNYASVNVNVSGGTQLPAFMSAKNFTFDGNACTGWTGRIGGNNYPEIIIPQSYSTTQETITMNGAPIIKSQIIPTLTSFTSVVFCKTDGSSTRNYTSPSQLSANFNTDFPDDDVVLVSMQVSFITGNLIDKLNTILSTPFIASISYSGERSYFNNVEDFTSMLSLTTTSAYFSGSVITDFSDGNDYQVTSIIGSGTSILNYTSGFSNYSNRIILLNNITNIDVAAFAKCTELSSVIMSNGVTVIGNYAFWGCSNLSNIIISDAVISIGNSAFNGCKSLIAIEIPSSVESIGSLAFGSCSSLTSITIPESVTSIGSSAFSGCQFTNVTYSTSGDGYTYENGTLTVLGEVIDNSAWYSANINPLITKVIFDNGTITSIGKNAFYGASLTEVTIPNNVENIGINAFYNCKSLQTVELPNAVTSIGTSAFRFCSSLSSIVIPNLITSIEGSAFDSCTSLSSITVLAEVPPTIQSDTFYNISSDAVFYIPDASVEAYKQATNWANYADKIQPLSTKPTV